MTVNPRTICVDVDNTLGDYTGALRRFVYDHFDKAYPCPDSREYDFSRCPRWPFTGKPDTFRKIHSKAVDNGLYELEEAYPHAAEALQRLHDAGWRIVIATARKDDGGALPVWLADNRIPYDGIYYGAGQAGRARLGARGRPSRYHPGGRRRGIARVQAGARVLPVGRRHRVP